MKKNSIHSILATSLVMSSTLLSSNAFAVGTDAGTAISNTATVSFTRGGTPDTEQASISFNVDEIVNVNVTAANASNNITNGDQNVAIRYTVTNTGNGSEVFKLLDTLGATNTLPLAANDITVYYDTSTSPDGFDPNNINEQIYTDTGITILNDAFITVYLVTDVPNGAVQDSKSDLVLEAVSQTEAAGVKASESAFGATITGAGTGGTNAIIATNLGRDNASSELKVTTFDPSKSLVVNINKTILGSAASISNAGTDIVTDQKIPGAVITYFVKVSVENDGATALSISDIIPSDMTYVSNSMRLQNASGSTINIPTYIAPTFPAATPVTYSNFSALTDAADANDGASTSVDGAARVESITVVLGDLPIGEYAILLDATINN